ncbi:unnamed protein product, partial [Mesorhabditis belari]|uniref:C3H1-type domain-containing protein n=1 Tax=Mesorhabditis belari TaxID=2138241 RepID=A0AAF3J9D1_9BILA
MVDVLSAQSERIDTKMGDADMKDLDLEDGELPEEGEIDDDDEVPETSVATIAPAAPASSNRRHSNSPGRSSPDKAKRNGGSFLSDSSRFTPRLKQSSRSKRPDPKPTPTSSEKPERKPSTSPPKISEDPFGPNDSDYREEDRDYRNYGGEEDFGDTDYRTAEKRRRRSQSPPSAVGEWGSRPLKRMRGGFAPRGRFAGRETSHIICKFYREGFCRDNDACLFSHNAEDSLRHPELCKFYKQGFCKKGLHCSNLHGEFPCIGYHRGDCRGECGFSHLPLNDYTRPIFDKYNAIYYGDDYRPGEGPPPTSTARSLDQAAAIPGLPPGFTMPPGFPGGPPAGAPPIMPPPPNMVLRTASPPPSMVGNNTTLPPIPRRRPLLPHPDEEARDPHTGLPPPSVVLPQLSSVRTGYSPPPAMHQGYSSPYRPSPPRREEPPVQAPPPAFDINNMLAQFSASASSDDSPASPPPQQTSRPRANSLGQAVWRLLEVLRNPSYSTVDPAVASTCGRADPRMAKVLDSQFDAVTSLISSNAPVSQSSSSNSVIPPPSLVDPRSLADPRLRTRPTALTDPRAAATRSSWMPQMPQSSL